MFDRIYFHEVTLYGTKRGKCTICSKPAKKSKIFMQTLNPFNKNSNGACKSRKDINEELIKEHTLWTKEPITHDKCKGLTPANVHHNN